VGDVRRKRCSIGLSIGCPNRWSIGAVMRLSVPGNLLLLGEYAVTEEGGLGLALAVDRRVVVDLEPAPALVVEGSWGGGEMRWTRESPERSPLIAAVVQTWQEHLAIRVEGAKADESPGGPTTARPQRATTARLPKQPQAARILIDSSALFSGARKSGFGSSAAVAVALSCALLQLSGAEGSELIQSAARIALRAHRRAQGGRGSGYDVYASLYGGFGCLVGGVKPSWQEALALTWLPPLYIFRGRSSVSTPESLMRYERWKQKDPRGWRSFLAESNRCVLTFLRADSWVQARASFKAAKVLGLRLGESIGVSACIEAPASLSPESYKALGAGNELGIYAAADAPPEAELEPVAVAPEGIRWNT
jgi:phosphomevalonate kinase